MTSDDMIRGLVRAAEIIEQRDGGAIWDDEVRHALDQALELGWGKNRTGRLTAPARAQGTVTCAKCGAERVGVNRETFVCRQCLGMEPAPGTGMAAARSPMTLGHPHACQHANEAPMVCPCKRGCYCKTRTCKNVETQAQAIERLRRERAELRRWRGRLARK